MSDSTQIIEIVFLAMLAGFVALRLVSVLGRRTGNEKPATDVVSGSDTAGADNGNANARTEPRGAALHLPSDISAETREGLQQIAEADGQFDARMFMEGSRAAYRMILEAFWGDDLDSVKPFVADHVLEQFRRAIDARKAEGLVLDNRLISIDRAAMVEATLSGAMAEVTVRFDATLAAVTRDRDGKVIAGSETDAVKTHDIWTFSRHTRSPDPNWLLTATDTAA
ncbi:Tim44/TimA family putative adaptor protein [Pedomonas mirosovicensis]|uniref:Tim44/TimA family putative adaptor protein n=1 Tax=Pedomonas mirosovicensis TaxID=2908641 RepID=UPI002166DE15|nr:Tim44/TimA family putative adaptor protein [Pedomonas mirosovicensis]MCH8684023.1 Tim44/TimA family putative adaptor protein [Pedomonas mirosovicensis]